MIHTTVQLYYHSSCRSMCLEAGSVLEVKRIHQGKTSNRQQNQKMLAAIVSRQCRVDLSIGDEEKREITTL